jgi:hypothetical protein
MKEQEKYYFFQDIRFWLLLFSVLSLIMIMLQGSYLD